MFSGPAGAAPVSGAVHAQGTAGVSFSQAKFSGYAAGSEVHVGAVQLGTTQVANIDQAPSGAATNSAGLTTAIHDPTTNYVVSPAGLPAGTAAYASAAGIEVGLGTSTTATTNPNQIKLAAFTHAQAPPNGPPDIAQIPNASGLNLPNVLSAGLLGSESAAIYDPNVCPLGQPISYGTGQAANVNLLKLGSLTGVSALPGYLLATTGTPGAQAAAVTTGETYLSSNGNGTFGLTTQESDTIAPIVANVLGVAQVYISIDGAIPGSLPTPVTLQAITTGGASGAAVKLLDNDLVTIKVGAAGATPTTIFQVALKDIVPGGVNVPLSVAGLTTVLNQLNPTLGGTLGGIVKGLPAPVQSLLNTGLGSLEIDTTPHAIGNPSAPPTVVGGTSAAGELNLLRLNLAVGANPTAGLPGLNVANIVAGHLEAAANSTSPITCTIPITKSSNPTSVTAGQSFVYTIQVPNPPNLQACDLSNLTVTDTIQDVPNTGNPTFIVTSVDNGGRVISATPNRAVVQWTGLSYKQPNPPLQLHINVSVPRTSPSGIIEDTAVPVAQLTNCTGGVSHTTGIGGVNGITLTGSVTLQQPTVTAATLAAGAAPAKAKPALAFTGGPSGLWQPVAGVIALGAGLGALALVRRSRRRVV